MEADVLPHNDVGLFWSCMNSLVALGLLPYVTSGFVNITSMSCEDRKNRSIYLEDILKWPRKVFSSFQKLKWQEYTLESRTLQNQGTRHIFEWIYSVADVEPLIK